jgi:hypothetical protein
VTWEEQRDLQSPNSKEKKKKNEQNMSNTVLGYEEACEMNDYGCCCCCYCRYHHNNRQLVVVAAMTVLRFFIIFKANARVLH